MSLSSGEWLLDDGQSTSDTYCSILTTHVLAGFQRVTVAVGINGGSVHNVILDARSDGVGVRVIMANGRSGYIWAYCRCLLDGKLATVQIIQVTERTFKT